MFKTMLHDPDFIAFQGEQPNSFEPATGRTLDELRQSLADGTTNYVMPTMLAPAFKLEDCLCVGQDRVQNALRNPDTKLWLKVLCAVLFGQEPDVKREKIKLSDQADNPMILRALQKTLREHGNVDKTFTVFTRKNKDGSYAPIAFSFSNIKTGLCPAVNMNPNDFDDSWLNADDVVSYLEEEAYQSYCKAMVDFLEYDANGQHVHGILDDGMYYVCTALRNTLSGFLAPDAIGVVYHREWLPNGAAFVDYTSWFTDKLLCLTCPDLGQGVCDINGSALKFILPLKRDCANIPDALDAICGSVRGTEVGNDITITFSYNNHQYTKTYTEDNIIRSDAPYKLTNVAVWPDKKCAEWDRYYLYISNSVPANNANPATAAERQAIIRNSYKASAYVNGSWSAPVQERQGVVANRPNIPRSVEMIDHVIELSAYPEAISLTTQNDEEVGMLLPMQESLNVAGMGSAQLGIDFGTSNTLAYLRMDGQITPTPLSIDDSRRILIHSVCGATPSDDMNLNFAPDGAKGHDLPFKTVVRKLPVCDANNVNAFSALIAPLHYRTDLREEVREGLNMDDDLKWPTAAAGINCCTLGYLEYLLLMWLWQVRKSQNITNINYVFTYPKSQNLALFQNTIATLIGKMPVNFQNANPVYKTESEVVFSFVNNTAIFQQMAAAHHTINTNTGYLLMDIGGGSVDISLWQNDGQSAKLCTEVSLKDFAGNHMQVDQVRSQQHQRPQLLEEILNITDGSLTQTLTDQQLQQSPIRQQIMLYRAALNANPGAEASFRRLWTAEVDMLQNSLQAGRYTGDGTRLAKRDAYVKQIECYFHYLFFFSGYLTGQAIKEQVLQQRNGVFSVLLAGNGSRMYDLVDQGTQSFNLNNYNMFVQGMEFATNNNFPFASFDIVPSVRPKHEVAFGAACSGQNAAAGAGAQGPMTPAALANNAPIQFAGPVAQLGWLQDNNNPTALFNDAQAYVQTFLQALDNCWDSTVIQPIFGGDVGCLWNNVHNPLQARCAALSTFPEAIVEAFKIMEASVNL